MEIVSQNVRVPKAAELVANNLRNQIVKGQLKEGEPLPLESEMLVQFGVSRPTLREACRILESEGLISISRGTRGARVHLPKTELAARYLGLILQSNGVMVSDVYYARVLMEPPAARIVAQSPTPQAIERLNACIAEERRFIEDVEQFSRSSNEFHRTLVELSGVRTLTVIVDMLNEMLGRHLLQIYIRAAGEADSLVSRKKAVRAQEKLVTLIEAGDADGAATFWREHLSIVTSTINKWQHADSVVDLTSGVMT
ncbi:MAG: FCD domain-containing protein [Sphingobium sp.]|uniref:FadR/GntR family transcriptional regulator n=1 Tax=Sphingobium sp. TaxID=1912891 RepID=UPI002E2458C0